MYKIFNTVDEVAHYTAQRVLEKAKTKPHAILGLATGSTMEPVYKQLVQLVEQSSIDLSQLTTFNLDEYIGLSANHQQSYCYFMCQHLFTKLSKPVERYNLPNGLAEDIETACQAYSQAISSRTHVVELSEQTRQDNSRFFDDKEEMPTHAITMGIQDILEAKEVLLVVTGRHKAKIMADFYNSNINEALPASALKRHKNVTYVLDAAAASGLAKNCADNFK